jgi:hypothetical protein
MANQGVFAGDALKWREGNHVDFMGKNTDHKWANNGKCPVHQIGRKCVRHIGETDFVVIAEETLF